MLLQGLVLMVVGLFMVFSFLLLLVLILMACEKIIPRFSYILPDAQSISKVRRPAPSGSAAPAHDADEQIAVAIAVVQNEHAASQR
jgi:sodium pump decarboxylase gamma subunit